MSCMINSRDDGMGWFVDGVLVISHLRRRVTLVTCCDTNDSSLGNAVPLPRCVDELNS